MQSTVSPVDAAALFSAETVVLILGCKVEPDNTPGDWLRSRLETAVATCQTLTTAPFVIIVSGGAMRSVVAEGVVMKTWLEWRSAGCRIRVL